jgi:hypothetical protein
VLPAPGQCPALPPVVLLLLPHTRSQGPDSPSRLWIPTPGSKALTRLRLQVPATRGSPEGTPVVDSQEQSCPSGREDVVLQGRGPVVGVHHVAGGPAAAAAGEPGQAAAADGGEGLMVGGWVGGWVGG